jgi:hypothetical protein
VGFAIPVDVVKSSVTQIIDTGRVGRATPVAGRRPCVLVAQATQPQARAPADRPAALLPHPSSSPAPTPTPLPAPKVVRPVLGISFAPDQSTEQLGVKGILVLNAREGGPAWRAGIRGTSRDDYGRLVLGDIITRIDGARIRNSSDLYRVLDKAQVGRRGGGRGPLGPRGTGREAPAGRAPNPASPQPIPLSSLTPHAHPPHAHPPPGWPGAGHRGAAGRQRGAHQGDAGAQQHVRGEG